MKRIVKGTLLLAFAGLLGGLVWGFRAKLRHKQTVEEQVQPLSEFSA